VIVLMQHVSTADTLLPVLLFSRRQGVRLRYVLKRELLWDPCLDVVGQRVPSAFVSRDSTGKDVAVVAALARGLGPRSGVLIYPEGTRFTPGKRERALEKIAASADSRLLERARRLVRVLPPRLGGALALLENGTGCDVVFCAHVGLEGTTSLADLWNGTVVGRRIRVKLWRVPAATIPEAAEARVDWLYREWAVLDAWVGAQGDAGDPRRATGA
jgi:1-acyl-sn-glycerol-3-phosphate acyltransferase